MTQNDAAQNMRDAEFLHEVRTCSPRRLAEITRNHAHTSCPPWKYIAIMRAWVRLAESGRTGP